MQKLQEADDDDEGWDKIALREPTEVFIALHSLRNLCRFFARTRQCEEYPITWRCKGL